MIASHVRGNPLRLAIAGHSIAWHDVPTATAIAATLPRLPILVVVAALWRHLARVMRGMLHGPAVARVHSLLSLILSRMRPILARTASGSTRTSRWAIEARAPSLAALLLLWRLCAGVGAVEAPDSWLTEASELRSRLT